ncbi:MAG: hypothetical protein KatS3mg110_2450 [Pirellulaceae bacterium]|nr:MAG: hypothetical protein KatS3mg110_2450 [Pirellulaceae bacterium]
MKTRVVAVWVIAGSALGIVWCGNPPNGSVDSVPNAAAASFFGGEAGSVGQPATCWELVPRDCSGVYTACASTPCQSTWFGYYCPMTYEAGSLTNFLCQTASSGREQCLADQQQLQACEVRRACGTTCLQSQLDGLYYCQPVGPIYYWYHFPVHYLSGNTCYITAVHSFVAFAVVLVCAAGLVWGGRLL